MILFQNREISQLRANGIDQRTRVPSSLMEPETRDAFETVAPCTNEALETATPCTNEALEMDAPCTNEVPVAASSKKRRRTKPKYVEIKSLPCLNVLSKTKNPIEVLYRMWNCPTNSSGTRRSWRDVARKKAPGIKKYADKKLEERYKKIKSICLLVEFYQFIGVSQPAVMMQRIMVKRKLSVDAFAKKIPSVFKKMGTKQETVARALFQGTASDELSHCLNLADLDELLNEPLI